MTSLEIAARVRSALDGAQIGVSEIARRLQLAPDKVSKSLKGVRNFTSTELARLAIETGTSVEWLISGTELETPRTAGRITEGELQAEVIAGIAEDFAHADANLRTLGRGRDLTPLPGFAQPSSFVQHGQTLAEWALGRLFEAGHTPWDELYLESIEDAFCVDVAIADLPQGCHGFTWQTDDFRLICLARTTNWARQRFTFAHELGHILSGDAHGKVLGESESSDWGTYYSERSANAFAGAFLMPSERVSAAWNRHENGDFVSKFDEVVWEFKVSPAALAARLQKLSLIDSSQKAAVGSMTALDVARFLEKESEFDRLARSSTQARPPRRLVQKYREAYREGAMSVKPLARLFGTSPEAYLALSDQTPGELVDLFAEEG